MTLSVAQAATSGASNATELIAIVVAGIALLGTIFSSYIAARSAAANNRAELQARHIAELEVRISGRKYEVYQPIIELLGKAVVQNDDASNDELGKQVLKFCTWLSIYGSDEAVVAFHNLRQASFNSVTGFIVARLYADFVLAVRRDIGQSDSNIEASKILGLTATNLYTNLDFYDAASLPFSEACKRRGWETVWSEEALKDLKRNATARRAGGKP